METTVAFDPAKAEAFAGQMINMINSGHVAVAVGIGNRVGLFETLSTLPPSTSQQIADSSGLNERYVREWLAAMVVGKIVDYDPENKTYSLAPEHAAFLTKAAGPDNLALFAKTISSISEVEEKVTECFYKGGGVPYDHFGQCLHLFCEMSEAMYDKVLVPQLLPLAPGLTQRLEAGIDVLDIGCGHGHAGNVMAKAFPRSRFTGYDFVEESIRHAQEEADKMGLVNSKFVVKDVAKIDETEAYDLITAFDAIHDQAHPRKVLKAVYKALRPGGTFFMADIKASSLLEENMDHPMAGTFYTVSFTHCMTVSLAYGGEGLGTMWGRQKALELLKEAGFEHTEVKEEETDFSNYYYISTKS